MGNLINRYMLTLALFVGCGCTSRPGTLFEHELLEKTNTVTKARYLDGNLIDEYFRQQDETQKVKLRDDIVSGLMALVDYDYYQYEIKLSNTVRGVNTSLELTNLGLSAAGAFVNGEQAKTTLAALATLVSGTRLALDKNLFYDTTLPLLIGRMQAIRETRKTAIQSKRERPTAVYPLTEALSDVYWYYQAGTITSAAADIARENSERVENEKKKQEEEAKKQIDAAKKT